MSVTLRCIRSDLKKIYMIIMYNEHDEIHMWMSLFRSIIDEVCQVQSTRRVIISLGLENKKYMRTIHCSKGGNVAKRKDTQRLQIKKDGGVQRGSKRFLTKDHTAMRPLDQSKNNNSCILPHSNYAMSTKSSTNKFIFVQFATFLRKKGVKKILI